jgi:starch phosphorylase
MKNLTIFVQRKAAKPMKAAGQFTVEPNLPENLQYLKELSLNIRWAWDHESRDLFRRLDVDLWEVSGHNPYRMLGLIDQQRLAELSEDEAFLARLERVYAEFKMYTSMRNTWYQKTHEEVGNACYAYFCAEFGLTESLPIYSGGLGVLAGDHLKTASDLGIPLVGVGLLYQVGYFKQYLSADGWQQEEYPENDFFSMPITKERAPDGRALTIDVDFPGRRVFAQIWRIQVGRVPLFLLDTNIDANSEADQNITDELYGGDRDMRIQQEILLAIGGLRALKILGFEPTVYHMNEGHSAFLGLERIRLCMTEQKMSFAEAFEVTRGGSAFTTHTPVPAGIDRFSPQLIEKFFSNYWPLLGLDRNAFMALGRHNPGDENEPFNMAILALKMSSKANAVSKLHGVVSRRMWQGLYSGVPEVEVPIMSVTNGVHVRTWVSGDMAALFDRYLGPRWFEELPDSSSWEKIERIPPLELWRTHEQRRENLVAFARKCLRAQLEARGAPPSEIEESSEVLDPSALTIGFARRFAAYKRGDLIFKDPDRLAQIITNAERPVQIIYAGKAHPQDNHGKEIIRKIVHLARQENFRNRIVFIENYDVSVARYLVQGVDVWLNNPRRFQEASGTSGMKAAINGALNVSILDGWWDEAYNPDLGWSIGKGEVYDDFNYQDMVESRALYTVLEKGVIPLFYSRGVDKIPRGWIAKMKSSMKTLIPAFSCDRMLIDYLSQAYVPLAKRHEELIADDFALAKKLAAWRKYMNENWAAVRVLNVNVKNSEKVKVGQEMDIEATVRLGALKPEDAAVEVVHGPLSSTGIIEGTFVERMGLDSADAEGVWKFKAAFVCATSGRYGYTIRIRPYQQTMMQQPEPGPMEWMDVV